MRAPRNPNAPKPGGPLLLTPAVQPSRVGVDDELWQNDRRRQENAAPQKGRQSRRGHGEAAAERQRLAHEGFFLNIIDFYLNNTYLALARAVYNSHS